MIQFYIINVNSNFIFVNLLIPRKENILDKDRKILIVEKLLQEELNMKKRKDLYPFLFDEVF